MISLLVFIFQAKNTIVHVLTRSSSKKGKQDDTRERRGKFRGEVLVQDRGGGTKGQTLQRAGSPPGNLRQDADGREDLVVGDKVVFFLMTFLFLVKQESSDHWRTRRREKLSCFFPRSACAYAGSLICHMD